MGIVSNLHDLFLIVNVHLCLSMSMSILKQKDRWRSFIRWYIVYYVINGLLFFIYFLSPLKIYINTELFKKDI